MVRTLSFQCRVGFPSQKTKIPHATRHSQKYIKKKKIAGYLKKKKLTKNHKFLPKNVFFLRPGSVVPTTLFQGIKTVNPTFRGYSQQVGLYCLEILNLGVCKYASIF